MYNNVCDHTGFGEKWLSNFNHKRKIQLNGRKLSVNISMEIKPFAGLFGQNDFLVEYLCLD